MRCPKCGSPLESAESLVYGHAIDGVLVVLHHGYCPSCSRQYEWVNEEPHSIREKEIII